MRLQIISNARDTPRQAPFAIFGLPPISAASFSGKVVF
jgi:hypothetical protein